MNWLNRTKDEKIINENEFEINEIIEKMVFNKKWCDEKDEEEYKNR